MTTLHFRLNTIFQKVNKDYKTNLMKLENFVMVKFSEDTMVDPKESEVSF